MHKTQETWVWSLGWEESLEEEIATHSSILAWKTPWTEEPGGFQKVRPDFTTKHNAPLHHLEIITANIFFFFSLLIFWEYFLLVFFFFYSSFFFLVIRSLLNIKFFQVILMEFFILSFLISIILIPLLWVIKNIKNIILFIHNTPSTDCAYSLQWMYYIVYNLSSVIGYFSVFQCFTTRAL